MELTREVEATVEAAKLSRDPPFRRYDQRFQLVRFINERDHGPRYEIGRWFPGCTAAEAKRFQRVVRDLHAAGLVVGSMGDRRLTNVMLTPEGRAEAERLTKECPKR